MLIVMHYLKFGKDLGPLKLVDFMGKEICCQIGLNSQLQLG